MQKASPSKGIIDPNFPYLQIAKEYEAAKADCISILTEPKWFLEVINISMKLLIQFQFLVYAKTLL